MKELKINYCDFWQGFDPEDNFFTNLLREIGYKVIISQNPDFIFFSVFGNKHQYYKCKKIFYTGENVPPVTYADWSFSFEKTEGNNFRLPHYYLYPEWETICNNHRHITHAHSDRDFCSFIVSNPNCVVRNNFYQELSKYKQIASGGRYLNNTGKICSNKQQFLKNYKFNLCFENDAYRPEHPGYTTEKIVQAFAAETIPIYWGNPDIDKEFNRNAFVNYYDFNNFEEMIEYIKELDNNDEMYLAKLNQPILSYEYKEDNLHEFIKNIFN